MKISKNDKDIIKIAKVSIQLFTIILLSHLDDNVSWTYKGYIDNIETTSSYIDLSLQKRVLYSFLYLYIIIS